VEFIFIALAFGVATAAIGRLKGGSLIIWFLVGTALPGIGIFAALLMRDERSEPRRRCPECGFVLPVSDQVCRRCGRDLEYPEEVAEPAGNPV
jgi:DNA-directed RNA polymerase subunit RPC12/RpoP